MKMRTLILVAATVIVPVASVRSQDGVVPAREPAETSAQKIKNLQKERIATLKELVDGLDVLVKAARADFGELLEARLLLLQAELNAAEKGEERIALYKKTIDSFNQYEEWAKERVRAARANQTIVLRIKARRLEVEIQLEQAKAKAAKEGK
jgi:hypothetical protein